MLSLKQKLAKNYINARGWRTKRKLFLIESDDWGSIRMPSRKVYENFLSKRINVADNYFDKFDSLEGNEDFENLFEILYSIIDFNGNPAKLTAFTLVANPDFIKIKKYGKKEYYYESIIDSYKRSAHTDNSYNLFKEGIDKGIVYPQFHGREHINIFHWLSAIRSDSQKEKIAFENFALISSKMENDIYSYPFNYFSAFGYGKRSEIIPFNDIITDGLFHFNKLYGFDSVSFVAPTSVWGDEINKCLSENNVKLMVGQQSIPEANGVLKIRNRLWGQKNEFQQIHWRRNCSFEPSRNQDYDWVARCLSEIGIAFRWGKPAVINSHRVNYIGSIFPENREQSLKKLRVLLQEVKKHWPDVEFIDTEQLARIMLDDLT